MLDDREKLAIPSLVAAGLSIFLGLQAASTGTGLNLGTLFFGIVLPAIGALLGHLGRDSQQRRMATIGMVVNGLFAGVMLLLLIAGLIMWLFVPTSDPRFG